MYIHITVHMKDITLELGAKIFVCVLSQKLTLVYFCKKVLELKTLKNVLIYCENMSDKPTDHWQGFFSLFIMYTALQCDLLPLRPHNGHGDTHRAEIRTRDGRWSRFSYSFTVFFNVYFLSSIFLNTMFLLYSTVQCTLISHHLLSVFAVSVVEPEPPGAEHFRPWSGADLFGRTQQLLNVSNYLYFLMLLVFLF